MFSKKKKKSLLEHGKHFPTNAVHSFSHHHGKRGMTLGVEARVGLEFVYDVCMGPIQHEEEGRKAN